VALGGATGALAERAAAPAATPPGLVAGAVLAGAVALLLPRLRRSHGIL
jgi:hypothetical protein